MHGVFKIHRPFHRGMTMGKKLIFEILFVVENEENFIDPKQTPFDAFDII